MLDQRCRSAASTRSLPAPEAAPKRSSHREAGEAETPLGHPEAPSGIHEDHSAIAPPPSH